MQRIVFIFIAVCMCAIFFSCFLIGCTKSFIFERYAISHTLLNHAVNFPLNEREREKRRAVTIFGTENMACYAHSIELSQALYISLLLSLSSLNRYSIVFIVKRRNDFVMRVRVRVHTARCNICMHKMRGENKSMKYAFNRKRLNL